MSLIDLADLVGSFVGGGGLTSLVTGALGAFTKYKELKLSYEHERHKWDYEIKMHAAETKQERYLAQNNRLIVTETVAGATQRSAIDGDSAEVVALIKRAGEAPAWAIARTMFRPTLTMLLFFACMLIPFMPLPVVPSDYVLNPLIGDVYTTIRQGFSAALGFWFGSRAISSPVHGRPQ